MKKKPQLSHKIAIKKTQLSHNKGYWSMIMVYWKKEHGLYSCKIYSFILNNKSERIKLGFV